MKSTAVGLLIASIGAFMLTACGGGEPDVENLSTVPATEVPVTEVATSEPTPEPTPMPTPTSTPEPEPTPIPNRAPYVSLAADKDIFPGERIILSGGSSGDPDGDDLTYAWVQVSGIPVELEIGAGSVVSFTAPIEFGELVFELTVSDGQFESSDTIVVTVVNQPPDTKVSAPTTIKTGSAVTLDGSDSSDPDGDPITFSWIQSGGDSVDLVGVETAKLQFTAPLKAQTLTFVLTVSDGEDEDTQAVRVIVEYDPVVESNDSSWGSSSGLPLYIAERDVFTDDVRTDVRALGPNRALLLDAVCFDNGAAAIGFRLVDLVGIDVPDGTELTVQWRVNDDPAQSRELEVTFLDETPAVYFQGWGFQDDWPDIFAGGELAVRIGYRGVQEDVFDLDALSKTPVWGNLVNCGSY